MTIALAHNGGIGGDRSLRHAIPATALIGVCAASAVTELSAEEGTIWCPYRVATGGWCPGCGCTRALKSLVRGNVGDSLVMNPWTAVLFIQALIASVAILVLPTQAKQWARRHQIKIGAANVAIALTFWVGRLATGVIPLPFG